MDDGSLLRILVATDIHLGKHENHPIRGVDSFEAFSEVMQIAKSTKPDILLLGGDLFDNINPSMKALYSCLRELKDVVFDESEGDDSIQIEVEGYQPNYLNKNLNIRLPIFSVHGNHDYPEELDGRSVFDLLQESNYINYIGRHKNTEVVHVEPLIISKGTTKVALYAMGYINTVKLSRLFERKKITFANPPEDTFNIMLIHQNRFKGKRPGADYEQCVHPSNLPKWINLLIWCHQHESIPSFTVEDDIRIYQPGSTVATSIIEAESAMKHIGMLSIRGKKIELEPYFLQKSYRPIYCYQLEMQEVLERYKSSNMNMKPEEVLIKQVTALLQESIKKEPSRNGKLPLVRAKIQRTGFDTVLVKMCERELDKRVGNPSEVFRYWRRKTFANRIPHMELTDEQLMDALKNKTSLVETFTEFEVEIIERMNKQLQKLRPNRVSAFDVILEQSVVKQTMTEKEAIAQQTKQTQKKTLNALLTESKELIADLDRTYSDCYRMITAKLLPNVQGEGGIVPFTRAEQQQINSLKGIEFQEQRKITKVQERFTKLFESKGELQDHAVSEQPKVQNSDRNQSEFIDLEEDDKCCPSGSQVYSKATSDNFQIVNEMLGKHPVQRRLKPIPLEGIKAKKPSKPRKGKSKSKKSDMSDQQIS